jgi:hypothetical protein
VDSLLVQLHIVAQIDSDHWVNFLILVGMAILWLFAVLIKQATKRKPPQAQGGPAGEQRESWQQRLARKAEELQRAMEGQTDDRMERMRQRLDERARQRGQVRERPSGNIAVRSGRGGEPVMVYERTEPTDSMRERHAARQREAKEAVSAAGRRATMPPVETGVEIPRPDLAPAVEDFAGATLGPPPPTEARREPAGGYQPGSIIDSSDPDALRKAILHYEILGKPIGLRDHPSDQAAGL